MSFPKVEAIVFSQSSGNVEIADKMIYGGKGAGLIEMCKLGLNVPAGIIIPVSACKTYEKLSHGDKESFMDAIMIDLKPNLFWLEAKFGGVMPLLSVRSGAPVSMPGMMDTILNVGSIGNHWVETHFAAKLGARAFKDCQRRLIEMLGTTAFNIPAKAFADLREKRCASASVKSERDLGADQLDALVVSYLELWESLVLDQFPSFEYQLRSSIEAVFDSWNSERAIEYRKLNNIPNTYGTAVTIQAMVFGNRNDQSATGVLFSRNPSTGEGGIFGEFLINAQGEDVVAGTATPLHLDGMILSKHFDGIHQELSEVAIKLESHYNDMVDVEFTVEDGELFILQSRVGKRSALAAFVVAHDMVEGGLITRKEAFKRLTREQVITIRLPSIDPSFKVEPTYKGLAACPGVVKGMAVHTSAKAVEFEGPCILVREETSPDDITGMAAAVGILTRTGGATSHAAVVARAMDKPCVCGATDMVLSQVVGLVTIDGSTGNVWVGIDVPVVAPTDSEIVRTVMSWAAESQGAVLLEHNPIEGSYVIPIGERWFDSSKFETLLAELASVDCYGITLDCALPANNIVEGDHAYNECFGVYAVGIPLSGIMYVSGALKKRWSQLNGLKLINWPTPHVVADHMLDYPVGDKNITAVPAEYALFKAIKAAKG